MLFDKAKWWEALGQPDWYIRLASDFKGLEEAAARENDYLKRKAIKRPAYQIIEKALKEGRVPLAKSGPQFDMDRQPIDLVVVHHSANPPGMSLARLNAIQLIRIYGSYYASPKQTEKNLKGQPVWSGHFYKGQQVFWGYHYFVRGDGRVEQILDDLCIGWQAGDWEVNTRSVGICFDADLTDKQPTKRAMKAVADLIKTEYSFVQPTRIVGHGDINSQTICPGNLFKSTWRQKIINQLKT